MKIKIYELAKELGISSKDLMETIGSLRIETPTNHFASISKEDADAVRRHILRGALDTSSAETEEAAAPIVKPKKKTEQVIIRRKSAGEEKRVVRTESDTSNVEIPEELLGVGFAKGTKTNDA